MFPFWKHPILFQYNSLCRFKMIEKISLINEGEFQYNSLCRFKASTATNLHTVSTFQYNSLCRFKIYQHREHQARKYFNTTACVGSSQFICFSFSCYFDFNTTACVGSSFGIYLLNKYYAISIQQLVSVQAFNLFSSSFLCSNFNTTACVGSRGDDGRTSEYSLRFQYNSLCRFKTHKQKILFCWWRISIQQLVSVQESYYGTKSQ